jgi:hypothetical protein
LVRQLALCLLLKPQFLLLYLLEEQLELLSLEFGTP